MKKLLVLIVAAAAAYYGYQHFAKAGNRGKNDPEFRGAIERLDQAIESEKRAGSLDAADRMETARGKALRAIEAGDKEEALAHVSAGMRLAGAGGAEVAEGAHGTATGVAPGTGGGAGPGGGSMLGQQLQAIDMQRTIQNSQVTPQLHGVRQKARAAVESANRASRAGAGED